MNGAKRERWLAERKSGLGGSDLGAVLGLSPYRTAVDVWADKTGRAPPIEPNLQMRFGSFAEKFVADEYQARTQHVVQRYNAMLHHPVAPILGNIDRLVVPEGKKFAAYRRTIVTDRGMEAKTASAFAASDSEQWGAEGSDQIPPAYLVQCAAYMALTGCEYWDLAVLFGNQEVRVYNLSRDRELEREIISRATEWWNAYVVTDTAPPPVCDSDVRLLFPEDDGRAIEADERAADLVNHAAILKREIEEREIALQGDADSLGILGELKSYMGTASRLVIADRELATWKTPKDSQVIDWKAVALELAPPPELIAAYTTTKANSRRFMLKG